MVCYWCAGKMLAARISCTGTFRLRRLGLLVSASENLPTSSDITDVNVELAKDVGMIDLI